jgi:hypothetical protein
MSVPLFMAASGMMMPSERAATISLRMGKWYGSGRVPIGNIDTRAQSDVIIESNNLVFSTG